MSPTTDRTSHWFSVAAFSTIALVSITSSFLKDVDLKDQPDDTKWAVSAVSICLAFSALAVFANLLLKEKFVDTPMEGGLAFFTAGFWAAVLPTIMDPDNALALAQDDVARNTFIVNNNLYFFSWASFIMSFFVLFGYLKIFLDLHGRQSFAWAGLSMTSFVAFVAAVRQYDDWNCDGTNDFGDQCKRTKLALSVGLISGCIGLVWEFLGRWMKGKLGTIIDVALTWFVFVMWIFGIIYVVFGDEQAAARELNNLYFFTWFSFALSVMMAMKSLKKLMGKEEAEANETEEEPTMEHKEVVHVPEPVEAAVEDPAPAPSEDIEAAA